MKPAAIERNRQCEEMRRRAIACARAVLTWLHIYHRRRAGISKKGA